MDGHLSQPLVHLQGREGPQEAFAGLPGRIIRGIKRIYPAPAVGDEPQHPVPVHGEEGVPRIRNGILKPAFPAVIGYDGIPL